MSSRLTLSIHQSVIKKAKLYAVHHETSISALVENYLREITDNPDDNGNGVPEAGSLARSLQGIVHLPTDRDNTDDFLDNSLKKHS